MSVAIVIYIQLLLHIQGQYVQIWYDNMNSNSRWSTSGDVDFPYNSECGYDGSDCARTATTGYIQTSQSITSYSDIRVQIDVDTWDLESGERCKIWYKFDSGSWIEWASYVDDGSSSGLFFDNEILNVAVPTTSSNTFWLRCGTVGSGNQDRCYYDNVYLRGILKTTTTTKSPTLKPTKSPTVKPTKSPTNKPTPAPTSNPTLVPTHNPTSNPIPGQTNNPTPAPTLNPTPAPTSVPTKSPTRSPTNIPTFSPTKLPTNKPTITESPTNSPTKLAVTLVTNEAVMEEENDNFFDNISLSILIILILLFVCISCLFVLVMFKCYNHMHRVNKDVKILKKSAKQLEMNEMQRIQSVTNTTNTTNTVAFSSSEAAEPGTFDLQAWLNDIGLIEYFGIFVMNGFGDTGQTDGQIYSLNSADLKEMGILKVGHRKLILNQIKEDQKALWKQHKMNKNYEAKQETFVDIVANDKLNEHEGEANGLNGIQVTTNGGDDDSNEESETASSVHYTTAHATTGWTIPANVNGYD